MAEAREAERTGAAAADARGRWTAPPGGAEPAFDAPSDPRGRIGIWAGPESWPLAADPRRAPSPFDEILRVAEGLEPAPRPGARTEAGHGGSPFMSEDTDPPDTPHGNVARLHPPGLPHQASLDRAVQAQIGAQLRTMYEHYVEQPIPERLTDLVRRLGDAQDSGAPHAAPGATSGGRGGPVQGRSLADPRSAGEES